ncbi:MAG: hypothetical protein ACLQPH_21780 [Acidimicrobiales bacterium]
MIRRTLISASLIAVAAGLVAPGVSVAATHTKVGPDQAFVGSVDGSLGSPEPAVIKVVCPGPATLGQTGHPLSGQTVEVNLASSVVPPPGFTGTRATSIAAFFGPPPPTATGPGQVTFKRYGVPEAIPTTLELPCSGSGVVTFIPFPESPPTSRSEGVPVEFDNVAVAPSS